MIEFLTENARRAYPLAREWPSGYEKWTTALVDASIGYDGILPGPDGVKLISVARAGTSAVFRIGTSVTSYIDVTVANDKGTFDTVSASAGHYKVFLTVNGPAVAQLVSTISDGTSFSVNVPFALRCVSYAIRRVTKISGYSPDLCDRPVFGAGARSSVKEIEGGDIVLVAKDGINLEKTSMEQLGDVLRISAISAPADSYDIDQKVDLFIRGDDCISVETIPGRDENLDPSTNKGVVLIRQKCKPCCQCDDYKDATDALRPGSNAAETVKQALDEAKTAYETAVGKFNEIKTLAKNAINSYANIHANATSVLSGCVYEGSDATGLRKRIAVTLLIENMTLESALVSMSGDGFSVPGFSSLKVTWQTAGSAMASGTNYPISATLKPGDTLSVVGTFATTSTGPSESGYCTKPSGMSASFTAKLPGKSAYTFNLDVT